MTETDTHTIVGTCSEISERNGWTSFAIAVPGKQYPVKLSTKLPALIDQGRAVGDQVATWRFKESQGGENPNKPGTYYTNRYLDGVTVGVAEGEAAPAASAPASSSSSTPQTGKFQALAGGDRERSIVRQTCVKAASELYAGKGTAAPVDPEEPHDDWALEVMRAAARFETWILRDLTEVPFS